MMAGFALRFSFLEPGLVYLYEELVKVPAEGHYCELRGCHGARASPRRACSSRCVSHEVALNRTGRGEGVARRAAARLRWRLTLMVWAFRRCAWATTTLHSGRGGGGRRSSANSAMRRGPAFLGR